MLAKEKQLKKKRLKLTFCESHLFLDKLVKCLFLAILRETLNWMFSGEILMLKRKKSITRRKL